MKHVEESLEHAKEIWAKYMERTVGKILCILQFSKYVQIRYHSCQRNLAKNCEVEQNIKSSKTIIKLNN